MSLFQRYLLLGTRGDDKPDNLRRARQINGLGAIGVVILLGYGIAAMVRGRTDVAVADMIIAGTIVALLAIFWITSRRTLPRYLGIVAIGAFFLYLLAFRGEYRTQFVFVYPLITTYVLGTKGGAIASATLLLVVIAYFIFAPITEVMMEYSAGLASRFVSAYAIISMFALINESMRSRGQRVLSNRLRILSRQTRRRIDFSHR